MLAGSCEHLHSASVVSFSFLLFHQEFYSAITFEFHRQMAHRRHCTDEEILEILTRSDSDSECGIFNECSDDDDSSEESRSDTPPRTSPSRARQDSSSDSESEDESIRKRPRRSDNEEFDWQKRDFSPALHSFDESSSGHNCQLAPDSSVLSFFMLFLSEDLLKFIALETNRFYTFTMANTSESVRSRLSTWKDTGFEELYSFIGIWLLMARVKKLRIKEYWSRDVLLSTPIFGEVMSRDRFMLLLRMLHFSDNSANRGDDSLFKIRKIIDTVRVTFRSAFNPYKKLCVDESLLLFKGRLSFKQFIPSKRSRFGIKTFVLCDCKTGYVLDFIVYTGTTTEIDVHNLGKSGDIVATLMKPYLERGHTLYVDNWYTSPALFLWLHNHRTAACGTVRSNRRNFPKLQKKLKRGELEFMSTDTMLAIKWCDKRDVFMLTTCNTTEMRDTGKTNRKTGEKVMKPQCVVDYNANMGAVDHSDMLLSSVASVRKSVKWYKKFFFFILWTFVF